MNCIHSVFLIEYIYGKTVKMLLRSEFQGNIESHCKLDCRHYRIQIFIEKRSVYKRILQQINNEIHNFCVLKFNVILSFHNSYTILLHENQSNTRLFLSIFYNKTHLFLLVLYNDSIFYNFCKYYHIRKSRTFYSPAPHTL